MRASIWPELDNFKHISDDKKIDFLAKYSSRGKAGEGFGSQKKGLPEWLSPKKWPAIFRILNFREKLAVVGVSFLILSLLAFWAYKIYYTLTIPVPEKGGHYIEGVVGYPQYINPLFSQSGGADADLVQLVFSGLFKYNKNGKAVEDLAERYEVSENNTVYKVYLKKNLKWHDGAVLTAGDVCFTYKILQDRSYNSPLRFNLQGQGMEVECMDDYTIKFTVKEARFWLLDNLTVGILPKHIWQDVPPEKFLLSEFNLKPIGSGPYQFYDFQKDSEGTILSYELNAFPGYYGGEPYISKITFNFYAEENSDGMIKAYNQKEILGISNLKKDKIPQINSAKTDFHEIRTPRYFYVYFNENKSVPLADLNVRKAFSLATDRGEIVDKVLGGQGQPIYSPFTPQMSGYSEDINKYALNIEAANKLLEDGGWKMDSENVREKNGVKLELNLCTTDWPQLAQTADILKAQWEKIGARINVNILAWNDLQQNYIRPREYDALLFGQEINFNFDPYNLWHSSQKKDPGLNLAMFDNKDADKLLEEARSEFDDLVRSEKYKNFQKVVNEQVPGVFLYNISYIYPVSNKVRGMTVENANSPAQRFVNVEKWYIKTQRVKK